MDCSTVYNLLNEYVENRLSDSVSQTMSEHLQGCKKCAAEERLLRALATTLHSLPQRSAPAGFTDDIMESLRQIDEAFADEQVEDAGLLSSIASASGLRSMWIGAKMMTQSANVVRYVPRPTMRLRIGDKRTRSLTKLPLAFGFRW